MKGYRLKSDNIYTAGNEIRFEKISRAEKVINFILFCVLVISIVLI